jgi:predicted alpha/beta hydrolase family esterase
MYPTEDAYLEALRTKEVDLERLRPRISWLSTLDTALGKGFDVFTPRMPSGDNAQYSQWESWFSRIMVALDRPLILVGHSLGAMFLVKYLSEQEKVHDIQGLLLVAGRYDDPECTDPHTSFTLRGDVSTLTKKADRVVFFHSTDDPVVPYESFERFRAIVPDADFLAFEGRGHFLDSTFPELISVIKEVSQKS